MGSRDNNSRISALDGLRGIAILLVLVDHGQNALLGHNTIHHLGPYGVTLFFVLSGFLITRNLLDRATDLKTFYLRRFFRLMPAAWVYLLTEWLLCGASGQGFRDIIPCLFFFRNYVQGYAATLHFWSLSMEEQFYLTWPIVLLVCGKRRAGWCAAIAAGVFASFRFFEHANTDLYLSLQTQVRADALCLGCIVAILASSEKYRAYISRASYLGLAAIAVIEARASLSDGWTVPLYVSAAYAALVWRAIVAEKDPLNTRVLSFAPLCWLGRISYSVYLWQQLALPLGNGKYLTTKVLIFALCLLAGVASYYFIERPLTNYGRRLVPGRRVSSARSDEATPCCLTTDS